MKLATKSITKFKGPASALIIAATVITQTPNVALAKFSGSGGTPQAASLNALMGQYIIVISRVFGTSVANSIANQLKLPTTTIGQGFSILGPVNTTTGLGAGLLIFNHFAKDLHIPYYNQYLSWLVKALGVGNFIAGLVGGFLDPDPSTSNPLLGGSPTTSTGLPNYPVNIVSPLSNATTAPTVQQSNFQSGSGMQF